MKYTYVIFYSNGRGNGMKEIHIQRKITSFHHLVEINKGLKRHLDGATITNYKLLSVVN